MFTIRIIATDGAPPPSRAEVDVDRAELTIGREDACDVRLKHGAVSRRHCLVKRGGDGCVVRDTSANGVFVNDSRTAIGYDRSRHVKAGDRLRIGPYVIEFEERDEALSRFDGLFDDLESDAWDGGKGGAGPFRDTDEHAPFEETFGRRRSDPAPAPRGGGLDWGDDDDDGLFGPGPSRGPEWNVPDPHDHTPGDRGAFPTPRVESVPDPIAPFAFDEMEPVAGPSSIDDPSSRSDDFAGMAEEPPARGGGGAAPPPRSPSPPVAPFSAGGLAIPDDWDDDPDATIRDIRPQSADFFSAGLSEDDGFDDEVVPPAAFAMVDDDDEVGEATNGPVIPGAVIPEDGDASIAIPAAFGLVDDDADELPFREPRPADRPAGEPSKSSPDVPPSGAAAGSEPGGREADRLLAAFWEGVGVAPSADAAPEEVMRLAGAVLRETLLGLRAALGARAQIKAGIRVVGTRWVNEEENNPLKFSPTEEELLQTMLGPKRAGYMDGVSASREGINDIRAHEMALAESIQVAIHGLIEKFEPRKLKDMLEDKVSKPGFWKTDRRQQYWVLYENMYERISRDLMDDFHQALGDRIAGEYERRLRALETEEERR